MSKTTILENLILRLQAGDEAARTELLNAAWLRLQTLARRMKIDFPSVARWEETDDIHQAAMIKLCRALQESKPNDARHFLRLAALQIRRQLIDLARKYGGAHGLAKKHESVAGSPDESHDVLELSDESQSLQKWTDLHEAVENLDEQQREVFELVWYHELSHDDIATLLGVTTRTVRRRWLSVRLELHDLLADED